MSALRISCLGILLKHHLLRHHGEEIAPRGRLRPEINAALAAFPPLFELAEAGELPSRIDSCGEERLTLRLDLGGASLTLHGLLARRGTGDLPALLPYSMRLDSREQNQAAALPAGIIRDALVTLSGGKVRFMLESESRIGLFQAVAVHAPSRHVMTAGIVRQPRLARVA